jgi:hypothetical protein
MAEYKIKYASQQAITISLGSQQTSSTKVIGRESSLIDNTTNRYDDALVSGWVKLGTSPTDAKSVDVWVYAQHMDGSSYVDVFDGTDSDETIAHVNIRNSGLRLAATAVTDNTTGRVVPFAPFSIAALYGGVMPLKWGIFVTHDTVAALDSTNGNHSFNYVGITYESV